MWKSAYVGVYQLLKWKMHGETLKIFIGVRINKEMPGSVASGTPCISLNTS